MGPRVRSRIQKIYRIHTQQLSQLKAYLTNVETKVINSCRVYNRGIIVAIRHSAIVKLIHI